MSFDTVTCDPVQCWTPRDYGGQSVSAHHFSSLIIYNYHFISFTTVTTCVSRSVWQLMTQGRILLY